MCMDICTRGLLAAFTAVALTLGSNAAIADNGEPPPPGIVDDNGQVQLPDELSLLRDILALLALEDTVDELAGEIEQLKQDAGEGTAEAWADIMDALAPTLDEVYRNALTNGEIADLVGELLESIDLVGFVDSLGLRDLPGGEPLIDALGLDELVAGSQEGIDFIAFLFNALTFRFETESNGIRREHLGVLNTPMPLNVNNSLTPDVYATLSFAPDASGDLGLELRVRRTTEATRRTVGGLLGGLTGNLINRSTLDFRNPLPLRIEAVLDVPVAALTGGSAAPLRVRFGFDSDTGIPNLATLSATLSAATSGTDEMSASVVLETDSPSDTLALVGAVSEANPDSLDFDPLFDFALSMTPVPARLGLDAALGDNLHARLTTSSPTVPSVAFNVADEVTGLLTVDALPETLDIFLGEDEGEQVVRFEAAASMDAILAEIAIADGFDIDATLRDVPPTADISFGDGTAVDIDLGGAAIGEVAFTITDGPEPRNVPDGFNGAVLDLSQGTMLGARFEGFSGIGFETEPSLGLSAAIDTPRPVLFDILLEDGGFADIEFSNFPSEISLALADGDLVNLAYSASSTVDTLTVATDLATELLTATISPVATDLEICADQGSGCTGQTGGNVIDARFTASSPVTIDAVICLEGPCSNPAESIRLEPLTFSFAEISGNTGESCISIPFIGQQCFGDGSAGQFFINTAGQPLSGHIDADLGGTQVIISGNLAAQNRTLNYALPTTFNTSGSMQCNPLSVDVILDGFNINSLPGLNVANLLCSN